MKILLCTNQLREIKGSEMVALELIEQFLKWAWEVDVFSNILEDPVKAELEKLPAEGRLRMFTDLHGSYPDDYDLLWIQHSVIPVQVLRGLGSGHYTSARVVWHHMSSIVPIELPVLADIENQLADVSSAISGKVAETLISFGLNSEQILLFENPAPDVFADAPFKAKDPSLNRILVVSNHPPAEVLSALDLLRSRGVICDLVGDLTQVQKVSPNLLQQYQAVITIGKTVQYALSMGIPCYIYDHFGGPGWLSESNFSEEAGWHFSGRCHGRKIGSEQLAQECFEGFQEAQKFAVEKRSLHADAYRLSRRLQLLLETPAINKPKPKNLSPSQVLQWQTAMEIQSQMYLREQQLLLKLKTRSEKAAEITRNHQNCKRELTACKDALSRWNAKPWYYRMCHKIRWK